LSKLWVLLKKLLLLLLLLVNDSSLSLKLSLLVLLQPLQLLLRCQASRELTSNKNLWLWLLLLYQLLARDSWCYALLLCLGLPLCLTDPGQDISHSKQEIPSTSHNCTLLYNILLIISTNERDKNHELKKMDNPSFRCD
jgi:hypothetical protein